MTYPKWSQRVSYLESDDGDPVRFDLVLMAEVLWKDTVPVHRKLLRSLRSALEGDPLSSHNTCSSKALLTWAHRPASGHGLADDLNFFLNTKEEFGIDNKLLETVTKYSDVDESESVEEYLYLMWVI